MGINTEKYIWLAQKWSQPGVKIHKLLSALGGIDGVYAADRKMLSRLDILLPEEIKRLNDKDGREAFEIIEECRRKQIDIITIEDRRYPERLRKIYNPPLILYIKGRLPDCDKTASITIVGTRNPSKDGISICDRLSKDLARSGFIIVSGMARGIDAAAHKGALVAEGITVAVLGCGVDVAYPEENRELMKYIIENGAVISEYPPGTRPDKLNFPMRNRILAGLTLGTVVVEAPDKSGALITARQASDEGRDVFAVPGSVYTSPGTNNLIKSGAKPVTEALDVIEEYAYMFSDIPSVKVHESSKQSHVILKVASAEPEYKIQKQKSDADDLALTDEERLIKASMTADSEVDADTISRKTNLPIGTVLATLTYLELKGHVKRLPGGRYILD
ncbi:MAG: DNA-processing protein DprA [Bacillota bacterium]|nr:DNA-processing protein DprA [Bacillota bacterium]